MSMCLTANPSNCLKPIETPFKLLTVSYTKSLGVTSDEDNFGKLAEKHGIKVFHHYDDDDDEGELHVLVPFREKKSAFAFHYECKKLAKHGKLDECIALLEQTMLKEQKVKPLEFNFTVVMGAVARSGDVGKTVALFKKLKSYNINPTATTYTTLFTAFAEAKHVDLNSLSEIYRKIDDKKLVLNRISYNALLKAYAMHDSLQSCMAIFRDSIAAGFEPDVITFANLMLSCAKDKINGSRHALQLFRQMLSIDITPDGMFLLHFLQVINKCNLGNISVASEVLLQKQPENMKHFLKKHVRNFRWLKGQESLPNPLNFIDDDNDGSVEPMTLLGKTVQLSSSSRHNKNIKTDQKQMPSSNGIVQVTEPVLNLLDPKPPYELVSLMPCPKPSDRLKLIGGVDNVFKLMKQFDIKPHVKLLTTIASLTEDFYEAEDNFIKRAEKFRRVKLDTDFYNFIMLKRAKTGRHHEAAEILEKMQTLQILPNYRTWCILAMSCKYPNQGKELINKVLDSGLKPGVVFFTTLFHAAYHGSRWVGKNIAGYKTIRYPNYFYFAFLLKQMQEHNVIANTKLISILEKAAAWPEGYNRWKAVDHDFEKKINHFRRLYNEWLKSANCE